MGDHGRIIEQGTYRDLVHNSVVFAKLIEEYGTMDVEEEIKTQAPVGAPADIDVDKHDKQAIAALMQAEERNTGAVSWSTYSRYLNFAGGLFWAPVIILLLALTQGAQGILFNHYPLHESHLFSSWE